MIPVPRPVLEELAKRYGADEADLRHFAGGRAENDGVLFSYAYAGDRRLLKVMAVPQADERRGLVALDERIRFANHLGENGARVAYPEESPLGSLYETTISEGYCWVAYSMAIVHGTTPRPQTENAAFLRNWGAAVGQMHRLAREYPSWRSTLDLETGREMLTWSEELGSFTEWCQDEDVRRAWSDMRQRLGRLPVARDSFGMTHNDPHLWNLIADERNVVTILDFDVANHHWFVNDIAISCQSVLFVQSGGLDRPLQRRDRLARFLDAYLDGYEREHHLADEWLDRLDLFIAYRRLLMFTVMYDQIKQHPDALSRWKDMIASEPEIAGPVGSRR